jgi:hypothetical protein
MAHSSTRSLHSLCSDLINGKREASSSGTGVPCSALDDVRQEEQCRVEAVACATLPNYSLLEPGADG